MKKHKPPIIADSLKTSQSGLMEGAVSKLLLNHKMTDKRNPDFIRKRRETPLQNWKMAMVKPNLSAEEEKQGLNGFAYTLLTSVKGFSLSAFRQ